MTDTYYEILNNDEINLFITKYQHLSPEEILLKFSGNGLPINEIVEQIECRKKAVKKLPELSVNNLIYKKTPLEQCSSELTADYKSQKLDGKRLLDLTGGLGIDDIYFSKKFDEVIYCELDKTLAGIAEYNFNHLGIKNISVKNGDSIKLLKKFDNKYFDWVYADPARRDGSRRSVDINFYSPDVITNFELIKSKTRNLCLKLAPAFDISEAFKIFPTLDEFSVISVKNECKEVLLFFNFEEEITTQNKSAVILNDKSDPKIFISELDKTHDKNFTEPASGKYFYEPDVAIRKSGLTQKLAEDLHLSFINSISDYLISENDLENFPGRKFKIVHHTAFNQKGIKKYLKLNGINKANIARNNFPQKPEELRKMFNLKDGGEIYLFFTKDSSGKKIFLHCIK